MSMVQDEVGNWYDDDTGGDSLHDFTGLPANTGGDSLHDFTGLPDVKASVMPSIDDDFSPTFPVTGGGNGGRSVVGNGGGIGDLVTSVFGGPSGVKTAGAIAGALAGGLGGTSPNKQRSGYQGSIPQYTAVRNMVNAPPTGPGYRPGQGGVNYGGNVSYVPRGSVPNAVGTPTGTSTNPTGVNPAINPKTPSSTISNLAKVAGGAGIATLINKLLTEGKGGNTDGIKSIIDKITGGTKTTTGTPGGTGIAGAVTKGVANLPGTGTVKTTPTGTPASTVKTTPAGTPAGTPTKGGTPAGGGGVPRGIGGTPSIPTGVADDGTTEGIKETIGEVQGTAYDDDGNLMPGYELDENGDPVYVGDSDSTTVFNPDGTIGEKTEEEEEEEEEKDDTTFNWDEDMGVDLDEEELDLEEPEFDFEEEEFDFEEPEFAFDDEEYARGGEIAMAKGRYLQGGTDGMADKIPARIGKRQPAALSHGEFVIPADVVSHMGNGNSDAGAKKLYQMMDKIRMARTGSKEQGKKINPDKFMPGGLALAYANGGRVRHFVGGGDTGLAAAANAGITGSEQAPNTWAGGYMSDLLGKTQALTESPYQQYMGPLTAGASNLQNKVSQGLSNIAFPGNLGQSFSSMGSGQQYGATSAAGGLPPGAIGMPAYKGPLPSNVGDFMMGAPAASGSNWAAGSTGVTGNNGEDGGPIGSSLSTMGGMGGMGSASLARLPMEGGAYDPSNLQPQVMQTLPQQGGMPQQGIAGLQPPQGSQQPSNIAQQYMNPYLQSVLNPQMDELRRQNEITNMQANAKLTGAGAFGGGRQAIMNAENNRNLMQEQNKTVGAGYANAYDKAQQQFNTEQGQARTLVDMLSQQGGTERGIEAEGIAADKAAFEAARENPYKMLQFQQSMLNGLPISATNYDVAEPSKLVSAAQGATTVNSLLKNLGLA